MVEITGVELLDHNDRVCDCFHSAEPVTVRMHYVAHESVRDPAFGIAIHYQNGVQVLGLNTVFSEVAIPLITGGGLVILCTGNVWTFPGFMIAQQYDL